MALFGTKKIAEKSARGASHPKADAPRAQATISSGGRDLSAVLQHARITEKATMHSGAGVYTFDIAQSATKRDVMQAIQALYKVKPRKVAVVPVPSKMRRSARTGKSGVKRGGKKAYVYLKAGDTITLG